MSYMTEAGLQKLIDELHQMKTVERPSISKQIAEARDKGDLSENAEYDAAKEAQGMLEFKISQLEDIVANARVIDESKLDLSKVSILTRVKLKNHNNGATLSYAIVPEKEANMKEGKISIESPVAKGLLGKAVGQIAEIKVPAGLIKFEVLEISR